jgi:membrane associated rhomboid family serine protease
MVFHWIIIVNILMFLITMYVLPEWIVEPMIGFSFMDSKFEIWQPLTSMFLHGGWGHIIINMIIFMTLAGTIENKLGTKKFIILYFSAGLIGYFLQSFFMQDGGGAVGASGAIFGLLGASIFMIPNEKFFIIFFPFIGFKAKYLLSIALALELILGIINIDSGIGHMCHFGGGFTGLLLAGFWFTGAIPKYIKEKTYRISNKQVEKLKRRQEDGFIHPYTCCGYNGCTRPKEHDWGTLIPTRKGWVCPCGIYKQKYRGEEK